jgi:hypothetical protein
VVEDGGIVVGQVVEAVGPRVAGVGQVGGGGRVGGGYGVDRDGQGGAGGADVSGGVFLGEGEVADALADGGGGHEPVGSDAGEVGRGDVDAGGEDLDEGICGGGPGEVGGVVGGDVVLVVDAGVAGGEEVDRGARDGGDVVDAEDQVGRVGAGVVAVVGGEGNRVVYAVGEGRGGGDGHDVEAVGADGVGVHVHAVHAEGDGGEGLGDAGEDRGPVAGDVVGVGAAGVGVGVEVGNSGGGGVEVVVAVAAGENREPGVVRGADSRIPDDDGVAVVFGGNDDAVDVFVTQRMVLDFERFAVGNGGGAEVADEGAIGVERPQTFGPGDVEASVTGDRGGQIIGVVGGDVVDQSLGGAGGSVGGVSAGVDLAEVGPGDDEPTGFVHVDVGLGTQVGKEPADFNDGPDGSAGGIVAAGANAGVAVEDPLPGDDEVAVSVHGHFGIGDLVALCAGRDGDGAADGRAVGGVALGLEGLGNELVPDDDEVAVVLHGDVGGGGVLVAGDVVLGDGDGIGERGAVVVEDAGVNSERAHVVGVLKGDGEVAVGVHGDLGAVAERGDGELGGEGLAASVEPASADAVDRAAAGGRAPDDDEVAVVVGRDVVEEADGVQLVHGDDLTGGVGEEAAGLQRLDVARRALAGRDLTRAELTACAIDGCASDGRTIAGRAIGRPRPALPPDSIPAGHHRASLLPTPVAATPRITPAHREADIVSNAAPSAAYSRCRPIYEVS